jgi:menaquinone reductase, molybdopterin-binding-like subunit
MDRRRFLKVTAVTGASAALASCGHPENQIIRFIPDDDLVPGVAVWKPSICPLCPAGCGQHVRVMDADVDVVRNGQRGVVRAAVAKKLEGLAEHPVNHGALCARGQAAIQVTYHPDRLRHPMKRSGARGSGQFQEVTWDEALAELTSRLDSLAEAGRMRALAYLVKPRTSARNELITLFLDRLGAPPPIRVSLLEEDVLRRANALSFGRDQMPTFDLAHSRFVLSFGADFLGTWNSPVAQGAAYGAMRQGTRGVRGMLVQVESRMSQSGANADAWVPTRLGTDGALALGLAHVIMRDGLASGRTAGRAGAVVEGWGNGLPQFTPQLVERLTGVPAARIEELARSFAQSPRAVAIIGGPALAQTNALSQALAVNALNALVGSVGVPGGIQFTPELPRRDSRQERTGRRSPAAASEPTARTLAAFAAEILGVTPSPVDAVLIDDANPIFLSPTSWRVREALERVPFIASFGSFLDETSILADLILPDHSFLESWVDIVHESGTTIAAAGVAPPVMRPLHATRSTPDVLLDVARRLRRPLSPPLPWQQFEDMLRERFAALPVGPDVSDAWTAAQERGGWWVAAPKPGRERSASEGRLSAATAARDVLPASTGAPAPIRWVEPQFDGEAGDFPLHLLPYASTAFYDGSTAHLPWLQEMPDPLTTAMWSTWIEISPRTAERLQVATHDVVEITSRHGSVQAPVVVTPGIAPDVVAMPLGQGHESFTRYASKRGSNPISILAPVTEPRTGALAWGATRVRITRARDGDGELILFAGSASEHPHEHR